MKIYFVHLAALPRGHNRVNETYHGHFEIVAPRLSSAIKGCMAAFQRQRVRDLPKGAALTAHLQEVRAI